MLKNRTRRRRRISLKITRQRETRFEVTDRESNRVDGVIKTIEAPKGSDEIYNPLSEYDRVSCPRAVCERLSEIHSIVVANPPI